METKNLFLGGIVMTKQFVAGLILGAVAGAYVMNHYLYRLVSTITIDSITEYKDKVGEKPEETKE